jgi:hypothetical protein
LVALQVVVTTAVRALCVTPFAHLDALVLGMIISSLFLQDEGMPELSKTKAAMREMIHMSESIARIAHKGPAHRNLRQNAENGHARWIYISSNRKR